MKKIVILIFFCLILPNKGFSKMLEVGSNSFDIPGKFYLYNWSNSSFNGQLNLCSDEFVNCFGLFDKRVNDDPRITVGYVLRFTEIAQELKNIISAEGCVRIQLDYSSHTLTKPPKGWRNSIHGGVLNEMGSHLIDLMLYLGGEHNFKIESSLVKSVISDVDDIVSVKGTLGNINVELSLNWVNPTYRKPIWSGSIETNNRTLQFDQQSIDGGFDAANVDYYVRGRDFSLQMKHFIENDKTIICDSVQANKVHDVIMKIKGQS